MRKLSLLVTLLSTGVMAQSTLYVGDQVKIPMRSDDSIAKGNIITKLGINAPVSLIKKQANGWSRIKHQGKQGWIISRYLTDKKPTNKRADQLAKKLSNANAKHSKTIKTISQNNDSLQQEISSLNKQIMSHDGQALNFNKLQNKASVMDQNNSDLMEQINLLKSQNNSQHSTDFLTIISTLTLLLGLVLGFLTFRMSANKANRIYLI
ncbi:MAG TPA: TIGR04211 family SH3 domain-containing protein [Candidatus Thioglobus sp.]|jgi:SH3 domain protein|nr:TIGR04211 family SH3 domain-containing protein [Candidatus Thioglobus sp.]